MRFDRRWVAAFAVVGGGIVWYLLRAPAALLPVLRPTVASHNEPTGAVAPPPSIARVPSPLTKIATAATVASADAGTTNSHASWAADALSPEIREIRAVVITNPRLAEELVYADRQRSLASPYAEERDVLLISAIHNQGRRWEAKAEARRYFRSHPNGKYTDFVIQTTGAHPD